MRAYKEINYTGGERSACVLDLFAPDGDFDTVFVYFHGGGLEAGSKDCPPHLVRDLLANGVALVSADYRMYPDARWPDFIHDAAAAVKWVCDHIGEYAPCKNIFVGGSSAGGYLSMMLCFDPAYYAAAGVDAARITGYIHDAGQPTAHFNVLRERGLDTRRVIVDESCALYHAGTQPQYPPMLFIVADNDMQNRYEQTVLLLSTLKHFGHEEKCTLKLMQGTHCSYTYAADAQGCSVFAGVVNGYINGVLEKNK